MLSISPHLKQLVRRQLEERVARTPGQPARPVTTVKSKALHDLQFRATLPMMLPAILSAAIYTGMNIAETFEIPALIGVPIGFHVLSSQVYLSLRVWGKPYRCQRLFSLISRDAHRRGLSLSTSDPPRLSLRYLA